MCERQPAHRTLITVFHDPGIGFDTPILAEAEGVPLASVVDRVRAGEDVGAVAIDFGIKPESARLIVAIADACSTQPNPIGDREQLQELLEAISRMKAAETRVGQPYAARRKLYSLADCIRDEQKAGKP